VEERPEIGENQMDWFRGFHSPETGKLEDPNNERVTFSGGIEAICKRVETFKMLVEAVVTLGRLLTRGKLRRVESAFGKSKVNQQGGWVL
jgi:hypothetical protein